MVSSMGSLTEGGGLIVPSARPRGCEDVPAQRLLEALGVLGHKGHIGLLACIHPAPPHSVKPLALLAHSQQHSASGSTEAVT